MARADGQHGEIEFRRLREDDLGLLHEWLNQDFVARWYRVGDGSYEAIAAKYLPRIKGEEPTKCYLILVGDLPVGYIQTYRIGDYPEYGRYVDIAEDAAGIDLFIGHPDYIHRGLGKDIMREFLRRIVFGESNAESCVVGPEPANKGAIRAYEKAGFKYLKTIRVPDEEEPEYLMRITKGEVGAGGESDPAHVRPRAGDVGRRRQ